MKYWDHREVVEALGEKFLVTLSEYPQAPGAPGGVEVRAETLELAPPESGVVTLCYGSRCTTKNGHSGGIVSYNVDCGVYGGEVFDDDRGFTYHGGMDWESTGLMGGLIAASKVLGEFLSDPENLRRVQAQNNVGRKAYERPAVNE